MKQIFPMFLDHVDSFGKFLKFLCPTRGVQKHILPLLKKGGPQHWFCRFLRNTVPCEFPLIKYVPYLISFQVMTKQFSKKATRVLNYKGDTILIRQISQKIFTSEFMLPDSKKFFDALHHSPKQPLPSPTRKHTPTRIRH